MQTGQFELTEEFIQLNQLLKLMGVVETGGEAKFLIRDGLVKLNDQTVSEIRKKVKKGDIVNIDDQVMIEVI